MGGEIVSRLRDGSDNAQEALRAKIRDMVVQEIGSAQWRVPPMPTTEELARDGKLYSQAYHAAEQAGKPYDIITHLRTVWMPWIEAGVLTRPALFKRQDSPHGDQSAYKALATWLAKDGNDLKVALGGFDIPDRSVVARKHLPEDKRTYYRVRSLLRRGDDKDNGR